MPTPSPDDDSAIDIDLMLRTQKGDTQAFSELIRRHQRPLLNFFVRCGVCGDEEDLVQETFLRIYRYRTRYAPSAKFTTFLYLVARQVRIDSLRRAQRVDSLHRRAGKELPQEALPTRIDRGERIDVLNALARLSDPMREVVVLCVMRGFPQAEVAEIQGIPVGTVKSRLSNALRKLREFLEGDLSAAEANAMIDVATLGRDSASPRQPSSENDQ